MMCILNILENYMVMRRFQYCCIDGNTSYELQEESIEAYNAPNPEKFLFLLSIRAGGLEINLQTADDVILYNRDFSYVSCKDKMFTIEEDQYLLCWAHK
eukprot:1326940-Ditylum_brightwellii.AAC.1